MSQRLAGWATRTRAQMWPGIMSPTLMTRTSGACFLFGGVLVVLLAALTPSSFASAEVQYGNATVAGIVGVLVLLWGPRLRPWQFHVMVVVATLQITVSVVQSTNPAIVVAIATLYVFIACAAFFVPWPATALQLSFAIACCMTAFVLTSAVPWWLGLVAAGTTAAIGIVIANIGRTVATTELDDATGLPNQRGFDRLLGVAIGRVQSGGPPFTIAFARVDGYEATREEFGGQAGEEVLAQIVASWQVLLEPEQILARRGPAELSLLLPGSTEQEAVALIHRLRASVSQSCSAGVTAWQPGESSAVTLARVDTALRRAKRGGRNRTMVESANHPPLAIELRNALSAGDVDVWYQPIVAVASSEVVGLEALVRWTPPSRPDLTATEVVRVAEENNLIAALGYYVLRQACLDLGELNRKVPGSGLYFSVNVSGLELVEDGYAARVFDTLAEVGCDATQLVLEITETVLDVDRPSSRAALAEFRAGGVRVAIDDFGTGYSSLSRLQALPTDFLKLDASFIAMVTSVSPEAPPLLRAVASLADALHLPVIAEGVETVQQAAVLRRLGVAQAQGFYFGHPQPLADLSATLGASGSHASGDVDARARLGQP